MSARSRREALALLGLVATAAACGRAALAQPVAAPPAPLTLEPLVDLVPSANLVWLIDAQAEELLADPALGPALALVLPAQRFDAFAERHGGVDLRRARRLVLAGYPAAVLALAGGPMQPGRIEAAFAARALQVEGRAVENGVTRLWGSVGAEREQLALFGTEAVGLERGHLGPLRAAILFAQRRLHRARPALQDVPLATVAAALGGAPLRAFAPGPFEGQWATGLGGLLGAATAVGATVRPVAPTPALPHGALDLQAVLLGAWGADAPRAAERLAAAFQRLANDPLGRLLGVDRPLEEPRVTGDDGALRLQVRLDPVSLGRGLVAATDGRVSEIMAY